MLSLAALACVGLEADRLGGHTTTDRRPRVRVAYEAGPTGFVLARALAAQGIGYLMAAPSLIARSPAGRAKKNDARDAEYLARLPRQGELVGIRVPDSADEAARDLVRALEDARANLTRARHRLSTLQLRHGILFEDGITPGATAAENAELRAARKRIRMLRSGQRGAAPRGGISVAGESAGRMMYPLVYELAADGILTGGDVSGARYRADVPGSGGISDVVGRPGRAIG